MNLFGGRAGGRTGAGAATSGWKRDELQGLTFTCLDDCGFCCTFTPAIAEKELAKLRKSFPTLPVVRDPQSGGMHIAFQGSCGACTLLTRRRCQGYEDRPAHCRYFPFHVGFGGMTEVVVNRSCRGVARAPEGVPRVNLDVAFEQQVVAVASPTDVLEHERKARKVFRGFERNAREANLWADVGAVVAEVLQAPGTLEDASSRPESLAQAWEPYAEVDVVARPFYLDDRLRWITFERTGAVTLQPLEMQEDGSLRPIGEELDLSGPLPALSQAHVDEFRRLVSRDCFRGQVYDLVDASDYRVGVGTATGQRLTAMATDLRLATRILLGLGVPVGSLGEELARFYDSRFLDAPTIGGWL